MARPVRPPAQGVRLDSRNGMSRGKRALRRRDPELARPEAHAETRQVKLAVILAIIAAFAAAQDTVTVEGMVINKVTGAGIEGVTVSLWSSDTTRFKVATNEA